MILLRALARLHDAITAARDWCTANVHREPGMVAVTLGAWHVAAVRLDLDECTCGGHDEPGGPDAPETVRYRIEDAALWSLLAETGHDVHQGADPEAAATAKMTELELSNALAEADLEAGAVER